MRNAFNALLGLSLCVLAVVGYQTPSEAQTAISALVTATCGTPGITLTAGRQGVVTQNTSGQLCTTGSGGGGGGLSVQDGATFTAGTSNFTPTGGEYNSSPTTCTSGTQCTAAITTNRALTIDAVSGSNLAALVAAPIPVIAGTLPTTQAAVATGATTKAQSDLNGNLYSNPVSQYPAGSTPLTASATGTTGATTATLTGTSTTTVYLCSYSVRANATAAANVQNTITGIISGTRTDQMWVAPLASGLGVDEQLFTPCVPASAINTAIAVASGAPGSGGNVTVNATGYYK